MGDFYINILNYWALSLYPTINTLLKHFTVTSKMLKDNSISNNFTKNIPAENVANFICDHLTRYIIVTDQTAKNSKT